MLEPDGWSSLGAVARAMIAQLAPSPGTACERNRSLPRLLARDAGHFGTREPEATLQVLAALAGAKGRGREARPMISTDILA